MINSLDLLLVIDVKQQLSWHFLNISEIIQVELSSLFILDDSFSVTLNNCNCLSKFNVLTTF